MEDLTRQRSSARFSTSVAISSLIRAACANYLGLDSHSRVPRKFTGKIHNSNVLPRQYSVEGPESKIDGYFSF